MKADGLWEQCVLIIDTAGLVARVSYPEETVRGREGEKGERRGERREESRGKLMGE